MLNLYGPGNDLSLRWQKPFFAPPVSQVLCLILKVGGSVLATPLDPKLLKGYGDVLRAYINSGGRLGVVVGGGDVSRSYVRAASALGLPEVERDRLAIGVSRLNARLLCLATLGERAPKVAVSLVSAVRAFEELGYVFMGGLRPGMTTDYVALQLAQALGCGTLLKATDQKGVYDSDPRSNPAARLLDRLSYSDLSSLVGPSQHTPGMHAILDPLTVSRLPATGIRMIVFDGRDPENVRRALSGDRLGTEISARQA